MISNYANITGKSRVNGENLLNSIGVDTTIETFYNIGGLDKNQGRLAWYGAWNAISSETYNPYCVRKWLFGFCGGYTGNSYGFNDAHASGAAQSDTTFRPVFYSNSAK